MWHNISEIFGLCAAFCIVGIIQCIRKLEKGKRKRWVCSMGVGLIVCIFAVSGSVYLTTIRGEYNTPEEALHATYWKEKPEVIYKIQGETICTFIEQNEYDAVGDFSTVQLGGKWCELESKLNSHMGSCNDVAYKVISPKKSSETVILVNWSGLKMDTRLQIRDLYDSTFNEKRVDLQDGTFYYLYDAILPCIDMDYYIEINGKRVKPFSE